MEPSTGTGNAQPFWSCWTPAALREEGAAVLPGCTAAHKGAFQLHNTTFFFIVGFLYYFLGALWGGGGEGTDLFTSSLIKCSEEISHLCFWFFAEHFTWGFPCLHLSFQSTAQGSLSLRGSMSWTRAASTFCTCELPGDEWVPKILQPMLSITGEAQETKNMPHFPMRNHVFLKADKKKEQSKEHRSPPTQLLCQDRKSVV